MPQIYPDTLADLEQALKDCVQVSKFLPDRIIYLSAVRDGHSEVFRMFRNGREYSAA